MRVGNKIYKDAEREVTAISDNYFVPIGDNSQSRDETSCREWVISLGHSTTIVITTLVEKSSPSRVCYSGNFYYSSAGLDHHKMASPSPGVGYNITLRVSASIESSRRKLS